MGSLRPSANLRPSDGQMPAARASADPAIVEQKKQRLAQIRHYANQLHSHNLAQENEINQAMQRIYETQARTQILCGRIERVNTALAYLCVWHRSLSAPMCKPKKNALNWYLRWRRVHHKSRQVSDKLTLAVDKYTGCLRDIIAENRQKVSIEA